MSFMGQIDVATIDAPRIAVFGIGGGGGNGVAGLVGSDLPNVHLIAANTDAQALRMLPIEQQLQLGRGSTFGLGAGARPDVGRLAAQEAVAAIDAALDGMDFCFIAAGMGGGTGTGAAPIFAEAARRRGIPTIAVVTRPFDFEGGRRAAMADSGLAMLEPLVDAMVVVPNQRLVGISHAAMTFRSAMETSNDVLADTVGSIAQLLVGPAVKRLGLAEIANVIKDMGRAVIGFGECGPDRERGVIAARRAMDCPLLDDELRGASKLMVSVTGGRDLGLLELDAIVATIAERTAAEVELAWGASITDRDDGVVRVALIAQGERSAPQAAPATTPVVLARPSLASIAATPEPQRSIPVRLPKPTAPLIKPVAAVAPRPAVAAAAPAPAPAPAATAPVGAATIAPAPVAKPVEPIAARVAPPAPAPVAAPAAPARPVAPPLAAVAASAPLLDYIDAVAAQERAAEATARPAAPVNLTNCGFDELWLGDYLIDDPRRLSLSDQLIEATTVVLGKLRRLYQRFTHARHSFIAYQPPVTRTA